MKSNEKPRSQCGWPGRVAYGLPLLFVAIFSSCDGSSSVRDRPKSSTAGDAESADELLHSALATLNDLSSAVDLQLRPLKVVLDATTSRNNKTVYAVITDTPGKPRGRNDLLHVVSNNGRFRRLEIRPGDRIRFYVLRDERGKFQHIELIVQQVIDENNLYIYGGLNHPVLDAQRMEIWRYGDEKVQAIRDRIERHAARKRGALVWEPAPDEAGLLQLIDYLNGWMHRNPSTENWEPDPLVAGLSDAARKELDEESLADLVFNSSDARRLQEAVWLRDASRWAAAGAFNDLDIARKLFDWTVRNIRLAPEDWPGGDFNQLWHVLLYGQGTARQRAWVFTQLARQQGLTAVVLGIDHGSKAGTDDTTAAIDFWCAALLSEGKLYLFDCELGLPVPGAEIGSVASLAELIDKPELLRELDLDQLLYPIEADDLEHVVVQIPATPFSLSRRAAVLEEQMTGRERVAISLATKPITAALARQTQSPAVELWDYPFSTFQARREMTPQRRAEESQQFLVFAAMPELWKARVMFLQGEFLQGGQTQSLLRKARPSISTFKLQENDPVGTRLLSMARAHATFWLGLAAFEQGNYDVVEDFLKLRTLDIAESEPWHSGATYLLARACEARGDGRRAAGYYKSGDSPQAHGNRLRALGLEAALPADEPTDRQAVESPK